MRPGTDEVLELNWVERHVHFIERWGVADVREQQCDQTAHVSNSQTLRETINALQNGHATKSSSVIKNTRWTYLGKLAKLRIP